MIPLLIIMEGVLLTALGIAGQAAGISHPSHWALFGFCYAIIVLTFNEWLERRVGPTTGDDKDE